MAPQVQKQSIESPVIIYDNGLDLTKSSNVDYTTIELSQTFHSSIKLTITSWKVQPKSKLIEVFVTSIDICNKYPDYEVVGSDYVIEKHISGRYHLHGYINIRCTRKDAILPPTLALKKALMKYVHSELGKKNVPHRIACDINEVVGYADWVRYMHKHDNTVSNQAQELII